MFATDYSSHNIGPEDMVGFDLCVLASCDHSVFAYGTFGLWGSLLAGGNVIVSKGRNNETLTEEDEIYLRSTMPGWLYIDTRNIENITVLEIDQKGHYIIAEDSNQKWKQPNNSVL